MPAVVVSRLFRFQRDESYVGNHRAGGNFLCFLDVDAKKKKKNYHRCDGGGGAAIPLYDFRCMYPRWNNGQDGARVYNTQHLVIYAHKRTRFYVRSRHKHDIHDVDDSPLHCCRANGVLIPNVCR